MSNKTPIIPTLIELERYNFLLQKYITSSDEESQTLEEEKELITPEEEKELNILLKKYTLGELQKQYEIFSRKNTDDDKKIFTEIKNIIPIIDGAKFKKTQTYYITQKKPLLNPITYNKNAEEILRKQVKENTMSNTKLGRAMVIAGIKAGKKTKKRKTKKSKKTKLSLSKRRKTHRRK